MEKNGRKSRAGFSLTEAMIGITIFIFTVALAATAIQVVSRHNTGMNLRRAANNDIQDAFNDLRTKSGTGLDFLYDTKFSGVYYYPGGLRNSKSADYTKAEKQGRLVIDATVDDFNAVSQSRTVRIVARWMQGRNPQTIDRTFTLTASRQAEYGAEISGVVPACLSSQKIAGIGIMAEAELGERWIYAYTDSSGKFFLRGVKLKGPRKIKVFGYSTLPNCYFRGASGKEWEDSTIVKEIDSNEDLTVNSVTTITGIPCVRRFGGVKGEVRDGLTDAPVPNAIIQLVPLRVEIPDHYSSVSYWEKLTDANGEYEWNNLCPGNYRVFMHGSGGPNTSATEAGDFGCKYTQLPRHLLNYGTPYPGVYAFEPPLADPSNPPQYYAAVATMNDLNEVNSTVKQVKDSSTLKAFRVCYESAYDSRIIFHDHWHPHNPVGFTFQPHRSYFYHYMNTHFKTAPMMHMKGQVVAVGYNSGSGLFDVGEEVVEGMPLKVYSPAHIVATGNPNLTWNYDFSVTHALQNNKRDGNAANLGRGGFVRTNYYNMRAVQTDANGDFIFANLGPRVISGDYLQSQAAAGLFQGASYKLAFDRTVPNPAAPFPANAAPVFVFTDPATGLDKFAATPAPWASYDFDHTPLVPIPCPEIFKSRATAVSYMSNMGGNWNTSLDYPTSQKYVNKQIAGWIRGDAGDPSNHFFDLGKVRVLKRSALSIVRGKIIKPNHGSPVAEDSIIGLCGDPGEVSTWGVDFTPKRERCIFDLKTQVNSADMTYEFAQQVLPSIPAWDVYEEGAGSENIAYKAADVSGWGFGNMRTVTYTCTKTDTSQPVVFEMKLRLSRKVRIYTDANGNRDIYRDNDYYKAADFPVYPFQFTLYQEVDSVLNTVTQVNPTVVLESADYSSVEDLPDDIVKWVSNSIHGLPRQKKWTAESELYLFNPGSSNNDVNIELDVNSPSVGRPALYGALETNDNTDGWRADMFSRTLAENTAHTKTLAIQFIYDKDRDVYVGYDPYRSKDFKPLFRRVKAVKIAGHVEDPDGNPLKGATVHLRLTCLQTYNGLWPRRHAGHNCDYYNPEGCASNQTTDDNGFFEFSETDPSGPMWFGGFPTYSNNFRIYVIPPSDCAICQKTPTTTALHAAGVYFDGYDGLVKTDFVYRVPPKDIGDMGGFTSPQKM